MNPLGDNGEMLSGTGQESILLVMLLFSPNEKGRSEDLP
jgi:hypothetical protein